MSAFVPSLRMFDGGGFVAIVLPFLSTVYLPAERGTHDEVTNYRSYAINRTREGGENSANNGAGADAKFFCVRLSWNGLHIHQLCDPFRKGVEHIGIGLHGTHHMLTTRLDFLDRHEAKGGQGDRF